MTNDTELTEMSAIEVAAQIKRRNPSPVEVVDAFIERIGRCNQQLDAFVFLGFGEPWSRFSFAVATFSKTRVITRRAFRNQNVSMSSSGVQYG